MSAEDNLEFYERIWHMPAPARQSRIKEPPLSLRYCHHQHCSSPIRARENDLCLTPRKLDIATFPCNFDRNPWFLKKWYNHIIPTGRYLIKTRMMKLQKCGVPSMQRRSEETHVHILESAYQLFSKNGYDACSVTDICQLAGVSKGAFYHHFPSKQALFIELLENWLAGLDAALQLARQETHSVPQAILQMATLSGNLAQAADIKLMIILEFWTQASRDPAIWETTIAPYRRYQEYFASLIQEGINEGSFRKEIDPQAAARALVSLALGLLMQAVFDPQTVQWGQEVHCTVQFMLQGLSS